MAFGPETGLAPLAEIKAEPQLADYLPLHAAKGDFLFQPGRKAEAREAFDHAASLSDNAVERAFLQKRASACSEYANGLRPFDREASGADGPLMPPFNGSIQAERA
jgi:predicted RNA polymerase sigma factor